MKKTENIIVTIISVLLIIGVVMGVFALFKRIEETLSDIEETDSTTETFVPSPDVTEPGTDTDVDENPNFYLNSLTNTGYSIIDNKTYFFRRIARVDSTPYVYVDTRTMSSFGSYEIDVYSSSDSKVWTEIYDGGPLDWFYVLSNPGYIYVTYTVITNCSNPSYVLEDLNQNVFFNGTYFSYQLTANPG